MRCFNHKFIQNFAYKRKKAFFLSSFPLSIAVSRISKSRCKPFISESDEDKTAFSCMASLFINRNQAVKKALIQCCCFPKKHGILTYEKRKMIMEKNWMKEAVFYHIYPLGFCGAPQYAHEETGCQSRIRKIIDWIPHLQEMHINALYLGPVFSSYEHGYDTADYRCIDPRLGSNEDFRDVCNALHDAKIKVILDGVFNHVGRTFWAFEDVLQKREQSPYKDWFYHINFAHQSPYGDPFSYEAWEGHYNLVKLNLQNEETVQYLLDSVGMWMEQFQIDGLRLDAADCIDKQFFARLKAYTKAQKQDFWLMGEIIHGDYSLWANPELLDSVTNYECYKGLYSSHNSKNYFEIAYSLNRQYGNGGIYKKLDLYNFVDNHDVNRLASVLQHQEDLFNTYTLLYTMPGIPSIYYGSEYGIQGTKHNGSDADIRPNLQLTDFKGENALYQHICTLGKIRTQYRVLQYGAYEQITVRNEQLIYRRCLEDEKIYVLFNISEEPAALSVPNESQACELLTATLLEAENHELSVTLQPHEAKLLYVGNNLDEATAAAAKQPKSKAAKAKATAPIQPSSNTAVSKQNANADRAAQAAVKQTEPTIKLGVYRHYKGNYYALLYIAKHSETTEPMAVYRQLYGNHEVWVRPLRMFTENIQADGKEIPRFTFIRK